MRQVGNSWFIPSITDKEEAEHRVDLTAGRLFCTCADARIRRHRCKHIERVRRHMESNRGTQLVVQDHPPGSDLPDVWRSPSDLKRRLDDLKQERSLVQEFFKDVMVKSKPGEADGDYGIIPGTDKPTLFKAGAEKLCELYGYAPVVSDLQETTDYETGHYRVVVRIALIHKGSGVKIAEGIGECNTRESRYWYRWVFENELPVGTNKATAKFKEFSRRDGNGTFKKYRVENEDLFSAWNTIMKMAKKRALVDATLSATRSSGLFTQSAEHLDEWVDAEFTEVVEAPAQQAKTPAPKTNRSSTDGAPSQREGNVTPSSEPSGAHAGNGDVSAAPTRDSAAPPPDKMPGLIMAYRGLLLDAARSTGASDETIEAKSQELFSNKAPRDLAPKELQELVSKFGVTASLPGEAYRIEVAAPSS